MTLAFCRDLSAADWIAESDLPWTQLVGFGPGGFAAYARLRFLPDPERAGQRETDADAGWRMAQLPTLLQVLAAHTATADDCYFCVWEGFGDRAVSVDDDAEYVDDERGPGAGDGTDARPGLAPQRPMAPALPRVVVPHRAYWLFRGPLAEVGAWDTAQAWPGEWRLHGADPAFVWPADRAWCVARDVDPHWAGIGADRSLVAQLVADPRLNVVPADPAAEQPAYR